MIIPEDKKKIMTIMKMRKTAQGESLGSAQMKPEIVKHENGEIDGRHVAMQDFLAGMNEKSPEKMMRAMSNFHDLHSMNKKESETEE